VNRKKFFLVLSVSTSVAITSIAILTSQGIISTTVASTSYLVAFTAVAIALVAFRRSLSPPPAGPDSQKVIYKWILILVVSSVIGLVRITAEEGWTSMTTIAVLISVGLITVLFIVAAQQKKRGGSAK